MERAAIPGPEAAKRGAVLALALCMLSGSLGTSIANIALPTLAEGFSAPFHQIQWVVTAYLAAMTISVVFAGRLGDLYGLKQMLLAGLCVFSAASLLCAMAPNLWFLVGARALQGLGAAFMMTLTIALVRETAGDGRIGRTMGLLGTMSAVGTALGPSLGGALIESADWRSIFIVLIGLGVLSAVLAICLLPRSESNRISPLIGLAAFREAGLLSNLTANLLVAAVMMTTLVVGPFYLGLSLGLDPILAGLVMSVGPAISICSGVPSGRLVDAWGSGRVLSIGLGALSLGAFALSFLPQVWGVAGYCIAIAVLTPGYQLFQAANNTAVMSTVSQEQRGTLSGLLSLSRNLGLILGASVMGAVFAFAAGTSTIEDATADEVAAGMQLTFLLAGALMVAASAIVFGPAFAKLGKTKAS